MKELGNCLRLASFKSVAFNFLFLFYALKFLRFLTIDDDLLLLSLKLFASMYKQKIIGLLIVEK